MKFDKQLPDLSRSEYDILRILWKEGKLSVREVHDTLKETSGWAYTTTKTMMDRMIPKGLLKRDLFHGVWLYTPLISRPAGLARFIQFFADRILELDTSTVVAMFGQSQALSDDEISELQQILEEE